MKLSLSKAVKGSSKAAMYALQQELWATIFATNSGRDIAALAKRWLEVTNELGNKDRESLEGLRNHIAEVIEKSESGRDIASLSIRLLEVLRELDAMPDANAGESPVMKAREMVRNGKYDLT